MTHGGRSLSLFLDVLPLVGTSVFGCIYRTRNQQDEHQNMREHINAAMTSCIGFCRAFWMAVLRLHGEPPIR